jgi:hypothetical protein
VPRMRSERTSRGFDSSGGGNGARELMDAAMTPRCFRPDCRVDPRRIRCRQRSVGAYPISWSTYLFMRSFDSLREIRWEIMMGYALV